MERYDGRVHPECHGGTWIESSHSQRTQRLDTTPCWFWNRYGGSHLSSAELSTTKKKQDFRPPNYLEYPQFLYWL